MSLLIANDVVNHLSLELRNNHIRDKNYLCGILDAYYGEPWRTYHNLDHIKRMLLDYFEWIEATDGHFSHEMQLAILFHDIIYDVTRKDNEERSAALYERVADRCFYRIAHDEVKEYIMATKHTTKETSQNNQYIADLDLLGLSDSYESFANNSINIEKEFLQAYTPEEFLMGRISFLSHMLIRPNIYYLFKNRISIAKANIIKEMERLSQL